MEDIEQTQPRIGFAVLLYVVSILGALVYWRLEKPQGALLAFTIAVPLAALGWMISIMMKRRKIAGGPSPASKAYVRRFVPMMIAYAVLLMASTYIVKNMGVTGPIAFILAVLPALPLIGAIWAMGRLVIEETDEYQRMLLVRQQMVATGFMLSVTSIWGFLEAFGQVPHVDMYWAFIIWAAGLGVGSCYNEIRS